ncbi:hypothetical protein GH714_002687 [Hevea brasiliensis]|uniref:Uncharacterized protein n=1 Tax=Hevea brasiliensis TaxID=3981 RepID=A0A6A6MAL3_HEVBR|nr:hypothetical protein GH714_002687 [Hevea brasiliensis]
MGGESHRCLRERKARVRRQSVEYISLLSNSKYNCTHLLQEMGIEHVIVKSEREENKIYDVHQLDPAFYKKIISRSSPTDHSRLNSISCFPGKVPFHWELQPGKPRDASNVEVEIPIKFPPAVYSLSMPRPRIPPTGRKEFVFRNINKLKKIKNTKIGQCLTVPSLSKLKPNITLKEAKEYCLKNTKKMELIRKKVKKMEIFKNIFHNKNVDKKSPEIQGNNHGDDFEFYIFDCDDFTMPSPTFGSNVSSSSSSSSSSSLLSSSSSSAIKSPKTFGIRSLRRGMVKLRFLKSSKKIH